MKKLITLIACFSAITFTSNAQISFGPVLGLNSTNTPGAVSSKSKIGFHVGGVAKIGIAGGFHLLPGIMYSGKGSKVEIGGYKATTSLNYLEIPINAGYTFGSSGFSVLAGPYIGYAIGGTFKDDAGSESLKIGSDEATDDFKALDFGLNVGAMYQLPMGVFAKLQYGIGFADIAPSSFANVKNTNIAISVGMLFGGK